MSLPITVQRSPSFIDPLSIEDLKPPVPPTIQASWELRAKRVSEGALLGGFAGVILGGLTSVYLNWFKPKSEVEKDSTLNSILVKPITIGGAIGCGLGASYFAYTDYVHFRLNTNFVGTSNDVQRIALVKANYIFKEYAKKIFEEEGERACDQIFTYHLFVYPVKAADGQVYEHADIYRYLTENYPVAVQTYEQKRQRFPHDRSLVPPSSSPIRAGDVKLDSLCLDQETMETISRIMAKIFKNLKKWESKILQKALNDHYGEGPISGMPTISQTFCSMSRSPDVNDTAQSTATARRLDVDPQQPHWPPAEAIDREVAENLLSLDLDPASSSPSIQSLWAHHIASMAPRSAFNEEQISAVDEKALALKVCTEEPLSLEEIFVIKQLFQYYIAEVRERDSRIFKAISLALSNQLQSNIISIDQYAKEISALNEWYKKAKELYV